MSKSTKNRSARKRWTDRRAARVVARVSALAGLAADVERGRFVAVAVAFAPRILGGAR